MQKHIRQNLLSHRHPENPVCHLYTVALWLIRRELKNVQIIIEVLIKIGEGKGQVVVDLR